MKVLALTGVNPTTQALACELVLDQAKQAGVNIFVALYCDCPAQIQALADHGHLVELWRIGADPEKPAMDHLVDACIADDAEAMPAAIERQLLSFFFKAAIQPAPALPHQEQTE